MHCELEQSRAVEQWIIVRKLNRFYCASALLTVLISMSNMLWYLNKSRPTIMWFHQMVVQRL